MRQRGRGDAGAVLGVKAKPLRGRLRRALTPPLVSGVFLPWPSTDEPGLKGRFAPSKAMVAKFPIAAAQSPLRAAAKRRSAGTALDGVDAIGPTRLGVADPRPALAKPRSLVEPRPLRESFGAMQEAFIGVDVGTRSARAGAFDARGVLIASARRPIQIWREAGDVVEQSSDDIWRAVCEATRETVAESGLPPDAFKGVGFDATCSLAALDSAGRPVSVSPSGAKTRNVIVWMDHRATAETREINAGEHAV